MNAPSRPAHGQDLRKGRFSEPGRAYLVTTVTHWRLTVFKHFPTARLAIAELRACDHLGLCNTLAYVLMPDHLHWLLQLHAGTLSDLARRFKSCSAAAINQAHATPGLRLWQPSFHDHALRDGQDLRALARYIIANPLRAGLAHSVGGYPHWDAAWL